MFLFADLTGTGGEESYTWALLSGSLPEGLTFEGSTGVISGVASTPLSQPLTIKLTDVENRSIQRTFNFNAVSPLAITTTRLPDAHVGVDYSQPIQKSGGIGNYTFSYSGQLPAGLTLNTASGVISGATATSGFVNFGITVSDGTWPTAQSATINTLSIRSVIDLPLTVQLTGAGNGKVTSTPTQVSCSSGSCDYPVGTGYTLLLAAQPAPGSVFTGWSGACSGMDTCSVLMSSAKTVTVTFGIGKTMSVTVAGGGSGSVNSKPQGISCTGACSYSFLMGEKVALLETPSSWSLFKGWSGDCSGMADCALNMDTAKAVTATFSAAPKVKIGATDYSSIQAAYDVASDRTVIDLLNDVNVGTLNANKAMTITLSGGHNAGYTAQAVSTEISGPVTLRSGTVIFDRVTVR
jgi:hypothetical protein